MFRNRSGCLWLAAALICMLAIFLKSAEPYQQQDLKPVLGALIPLPVLQKWLPPVEFDYGGDLVTWQKPYGMLEFFIRKGAHVTEFAILTFLWVQTLRQTRLRPPKPLLFAAAIALFYAAADEWHQTFVPGRTGHLIDVGVDSAGIALTVLFYSVRPFFRNS